MREYLPIKLVGVNKDLPVHELPPNVWSDCKNIRFVDDKAFKCKGYASIFGTPSVAPYWVLAVPTPTTYYWLYAGLSGVYVTDGTTHYNITPVGGVTANADTSWNGGLLNTIPIINNGYDAPMYWDLNTSNDLATLTAWPSGYKAEIMRSYKNYLIAMNITTGASIELIDLVKWSDAAEAGAIPTSWDETDPTVDAGENPLSSTPGAIIDGVPLRDLFIIYKQHTCHTMQYVGGRYVFNFRDLFSTVGALSSNCVVELQGKHLVLTDGDVVLHDGQTPISIFSKRMRDWIFKNISINYYKRSFIAHNMYKKEAIICFPTSPAEFPDTAVIWNYKDDTIGVRELPLTRFIGSGIIEEASASSIWTGDTQAWDLDTSVWNEQTYNPTQLGLLMCDHANTKLHELNSTNLRDGAIMESYLARESMPLVDLHHVKMVYAVYPRIEGTTGGEIIIRVGTQMNPTDNIQWGPEQTYIIGTSSKIDVLQKGRYLSFSFTSRSDIDWYMTSFETEVQKGERY